MKTTGKGNTALKGNINLRQILGQKYEMGEEVLWAEKAQSNNFHIFEKEYLLTSFVILLISLGLCFFYTLAGIGFFFIAMLGSYLFQSVKQKVVNIVTSERVIVLSENGTTHRKYASIFNISSSNNDKGRMIMFQERVTDKNYDGNSGLDTVFHFELVDKLNSPEAIINKLLDEKGPHKVVKEATLKLMEEVGLHQDSNWYMRYNGEIDGMKTAVEVDGLFPIKSVKVLIDCPNYSNNFLVVKEQIDRKIDVQVGDPEFDNAFIVKSDARDFLETILTEEIKKRMLNCLGQGACTYNFGKTGKVMKDKKIDKSSQFADDEDVLDFQMLTKTTRKDKPTIVENRKTGTTAQLKFIGTPMDSVQMNVPFLKKYIENCLMSAVQIAKQIKKYNS